MTRWTDALHPRLASLLDGRDWQRVHRGRDGSWFALSETPDPTGTTWYWLRPDGADPIRYPPPEDPALRSLRTLIVWARENGANLTLLAHRPGNRAVYRVEEARGARIAKVYRKPRQLALRWQALPSDSRAPFSVPRLLDTAGDDRVLEMEFRPLPSLHERWRSGGAGAGDGKLLVGLLDWLRASPCPPGFPEHGPGDEISLLEKQRDLHLKWMASPLPELAATTDAVTRALGALEGGERVFGHRDLHDKQLLWDGGPATLIDLDLAAAVPPFLDAGNLLAHVRLRALQGIAIDWEPLAVEIARAQGPAPELSLWTAAALLRLVTVYSFRRHVEALPSRLLDSAGAALAREREWKAILP